MPRLRSLPPSLTSVHVVTSPLGLKTALKRETHAAPQLAQLPATSKCYSRRKAKCNTRSHDEQTKRSASAGDRAQNKDLLRNAMEALEAVMNDGLNFTTEQTAEHVISDIKQVV